MEIVKIVKVTVMALLNVVIVKLFIYRRRHSRLVIIRLSSEFFSKSFLF